MKKLNISISIILVLITLVGTTNEIVPNLIDGGCVNLLFNVGDKLNQQGLTYWDDNFYIGFDVGSNKGEIIKYSKTGIKSSSTGKIGIGHTADLGFRKKNGMIYVANGGGSNRTHVYEVDFNNKNITKDINLEQFGTAALLAIDNEKDRLILHTSKGGDTGNITFSILDFNGKSLEQQFDIPNQGIPQGLEYYKSMLYYYTNNTITCINVKTHSIVGKFHIKEKGESEGITLVQDGSTPYIAIGYKKNNRIYSIN
ncbi:hypothetical protein [Clostridium chrysemydis]|uniref:hypothetical protein n=1 Tax=Clostridium chrysemydis TaxID=2665504 RepID=UPI0018839EE3|nr:hypothetical protein [Clostridium chrysemydis]